MVESGTRRSLLRQGGVYASLYQEQFEGGKVQWRCPDGDILADGTIRHRQAQPALTMTCAEDQWACATTFCRNCSATVGRECPETLCGTLSQ